jgi:demethoxyubiquinone hydroxylase (CLK1/Coq7/Cat5 family)
MEQILAFVLGVGIALLGWGVVVAFKTVKKVKQIEQRITSHQDWISRNDELVNRRIDQEIDRTNSIFNDCIRHTDSRVDKLEAKLTSIPKEILKG